MRYRPAARGVRASRRPRWRSIGAGPQPPHELLPRGHAGPVAGEQLVAQRHALTGDDQGQADLAAVGPMIAAVPALGERVTRRGAFEVRARYVVEEQIVVQGEQLP